MEYKAQLMDAAQIHRTMARLTHEIIEKNRGAEGLCLLGIKRRGVPLAQMLKENILRFEQVDVPVGHIDISHFRDDREGALPPEASADCHIPCKLEETTVILVDDVLHTGRTVRAAIEAIFRQGRPKAIRLAVLIDRGHRELPFRPDFVGKNIPTAKNEKVFVKLEEIDGETGVSLYSL
ncbi:MAG: bifunctional pyr operon transcriptional regulator/uracil phosphoribosyltransferase PyrR [Clostridia bacterium]|jgi:pyrimidine operon attenuation protein/uracil phosphoribosyltransferase|nr:bifunctional pyr operon transcriptional regulator/uracil phosphoribosyltransferase PyrR [Clostridia bacterium]